MLVWKVIFYIVLHFIICMLILLQYIKRLIKKRLLIFLLCGVYSRVAFNQNKYGMLLKETPKMENVIRHQTHVVVFASSFPWSYQQRLLLYVISIDLALANKGLNFIVITFTMDFNDEWCKLENNWLSLVGKITNISLEYTCISNSRSFHLAQWMSF